jgi:hypothetical protein
VRNKANHPLPARAMLHNKGSRHISAQSRVIYLFFIG